MRYKRTTPTWVSHYLIKLVVWWSQSQSIVHNRYLGQVGSTVWSMLDINHLFHVSFFSQVLRVFSYPAYSEKMQKKHLPVCLRRSGHALFRSQTGGDPKKKLCWTWILPQSLGEQKWAKSPESYGESSFLTWTWARTWGYSLFSNTPKCFWCIKDGDLKQPDPRQKMRASAWTWMLKPMKCLIFWRVHHVSLVWVFGSLVPVRSLVRGGAWALRLSPCGSGGGVGAQRRREDQQRLGEVVWRQILPSATQ